MPVGAARLLLALALVAIIAVPALTPLAATPGSQDPALLARVDPALLDESTYEDPLGLGSLPLAELALSARPVELEPLREGQVKATIVVAGGREAAEEVASLTEGVVFGVEVAGRWVIEAWVSRDSVEALARHPSVAYVYLPGSPLEWLMSEKELLSRGEAEVRAAGQGEAPALYAAVEVLGASRVWEEFGFTGEGVVAGVVDTGVDFAHPDLGVEAIARYEGVPLIFDADEMGLVFTLSEATVSEGFIEVELPVFVIDPPNLAAGFVEQGWFVYVDPAGRVFQYTFPIDRFHVGGLFPEGATVRFGLAVQLVFINYGAYGIAYYSAPVIYFDSDGDGIFDSVSADVSTVYYFFLRALYDAGIAAEEPSEELADFSFEGEPVATHGSEVLARDFTGDGIADFSLGALAGWVFDWFGVFTGEQIRNLGWRLGYDYAGAVLPGLDPAGNYVTIYYDAIGHGTSVASVIASRGNVEFDLGYGTFRLPGVAPGAKIAAASTFLINVFVAQFFLAGFEPVGGPLSWEYVGEHQVDVINNSWGNSFIALRGFITGADDYSLIEDYITSVSGTVIVHAMGNGGPGFGTATTPGAANLVISVGASTLFDYRPLFGYLPGPGGDVVSWSDRGPSQVGVAKPDVVNIGSFAWAAVPVIVGLGDGSRAVDLFGGTSEATPMTSGVVALVIQAYMETFGSKPSPGLVKAILKSTARDLGFEAFIQGAGHVDAYRAVKAVVEGGIPIAYSTTVYENVYSLVFMGEPPYAPEEQVDTQIYTGVMRPGEERTFKLTVRTLSGEAELTGYKAYWFHVVRRSLIPLLNLDEAYVILADGSTVPLSERLVSVDPEAGLLELRLRGDEVRFIIPMDRRFFPGLDLPIPEYVNEIIISFPYELIDPQGTYGIAPGLPFLIVGAEFHVGFDIDGDGVISLAETARVQYDIRYANTLHLEIGMPEVQAEEVAAWVSERTGVEVSPEEAVPVLDLRVFFNAYARFLGQEVVVPFKMMIAYHHRVPLDTITVEPSQATVTPEGVELDVTVRVPEDTGPGVYQYYIELQFADGSKILVPVAVPVAAVVGEGDARVIFGGFVEDRPYTQYAVSGKFDWSWRYESGDWRTFPVVFEDPDVVAAVVSVEWSSPVTSIDVAVGGLGENLLAVAIHGVPGDEPALLYGSVVAGKLAYHAGFLGRSGLVPAFSTPSATKAVVLAPIAASGVPYWVVVRNSILDASAEFPETFTVEIRPIRAYVEAPESVEPGSLARVTVTIEGSTLLSRSYVAAMAGFDGEVVSVSPERLGFGRSFIITVDFVARSSGTLYIILQADLVNTYVIGYNFAGFEFRLLQVPGFIVIPIPVNAG